MPIVKSGEARIHYALEGQGGTPVLVFSNSLGAMPVAAPSALART